MASATTPVPTSPAALRRVRRRPVIPENRRSDRRGRTRRSRSCFSLRSCVSRLTCVQGAGEGERARLPSPAGGDGLVLAGRGAEALDRHVDPERELPRRNRQGEQRRLARDLVPSAEEQKGDLAVGRSLFEHPPEWVWTSGVVASSTERCRYVRRVRAELPLLLCVVGCALAPAERRVGRGAS
jgi:hypothetical protein